MTEVQKRLRQEAGKSVVDYYRDKQNKKIYGKPKKEVFPYTEEQYEERDVLARFLKYFTKQTTFTVFVKNYFKDKTTCTCVAELVNKTELMSKSWLRLYKVHFANIDNNIVYVTVIRKYKCTADKYFENMKNRQEENDDEWEGCEDW